jgi:hypothetical protein
MDEFNRSSPKVRNGVMELIQFKSINGKKFNNLKIVWAAINPEDENDTYDVQRLDPAQKDRFHVHVKVPYAPCVEYFTEKYNTKWAGAACSWWRNLPTKMKKEISPRRLDYALEVYQMGGDMRDVFPEGANIKKLLGELDTGSPVKTFKMVYTDKQKLEEFLKDENNYSACVDTIVSNVKYINATLPLISKEKISILLDNPKVQQVILNDAGSYIEIVQSVKVANINAQVVDFCDKVIDKFENSESDNDTSCEIETLKFSQDKEDKLLEAIKTFDIPQLNSKLGVRKKFYKSVVSNIPEKFSVETGDAVLMGMNTIASVSKPDSFNNIYKLTIKLIDICVKNGCGFTKETYSHLFTVLENNPEFTYNKKAEEVKA